MIQVFVCLSAPKLIRGAQQIDGIVCAAAAAASCRSSRNLSKSFEKDFSFKFLKTSKYTMRVLIFLFALTLLALSLASPAELEHHSGEYSVCRGNTLYSVTFNVTGVPNDNFIPLDSGTGVVDIECDYDQTSLNLKFDSNENVLKFVARIVDGGSFKIFVTSAFNYSSCGGPSLHMVRRVVSATPDSSNRVNVMLKAVVAQYDELIQEGVISLTPSGPCDSAVKQHFCVGLNVNDACDDAKSPIAIYSNQYISIACADCFTAFVADAFLIMKLSNWKVRSLRLALFLFTLLAWHSCPNIIAIVCSSLHSATASQVSRAFRLYHCRQDSRTCPYCPQPCST
jgi:hypothetical protein